MFMDSLKKARRLLKALGDDNRLRILNLLGKQEMNVARLCEIVGSTQPNISKHLAKLRLLGIVSDRREGQFIYYRLTTPSSEFQENLISCVLDGLSEVKIFKADLGMLEQLDGHEQWKPNVVTERQGS
jgi:ArsR family transcriptional regulator